MAYAITHDGTQTFSLRWQIKKVPAWWRYKSTKHNLLQALTFVIRNYSEIVKDCRLRWFDNYF